jgi:hypothetical protein
VPSLVGGGAERQLTYLVKELVQSGWDVHVAYVHGGPNMGRLEASGATVHRLRALGNHDPQILGRLVATIRRVKPDIVQCWLLQMEVLGGLASMLTRTPWVFSERSCEEAYPASLKALLRLPSYPILREETDTGERGHADRFALASFEMLCRSKRSPRHR